MTSMKSRFVKFNSTALALLIVLLTTLLIVPGGASAKDRKLKGSDTQAQVIAHISFAGLSEVDMAIQKKNNAKYYIYVQHSTEQGISVIDITKPDQPKTVGEIPSGPALSSRMNLTGNLAIVAESEVTPMHSTTSTDDLVLWDLSNPAAPRVVQKFSGVVKWLQDERNFIYLLNNEGLWVVSKSAEGQPEPTQSSIFYRTED